MDGLETSHRWVNSYDDEDAYRTPSWSELKWDMLTGSYLIVEWWCTIDFVVRESFTSPGLVPQAISKILFKTQTEYIPWETVPYNIFYQVCDICFIDYSHSCVCYWVGS